MRSLSMIDRVDLLNWMDKQIGLHFEEWHGMGRGKFVTAWTMDEYDKVEAHTLIEALILLKKRETERG